MIELDFIAEQNNGLQGACLKVLGIGGAGGNAVNSMFESNEFSAVEFIVANTDAQALNLSAVPTKIHMGTKITKGLGAGSNPDTGRRAAEEDIDDIVTHLAGTDILFLTAGFGGGTGTGGLPVIASAAKELGILTVAIVTKPFLFEGKRRQRFAEEAIKSIKDKVDTLIVVPNQRLLEIADPKISMIDAFALSNSILKNAVKGIADILMKSGHINVDFADIKAIMKDMGMALMGTGVATGEDRARHAALNAINSPLLDNISIRGAKGVLINITGNRNLGLQEVNDAAMLVYELVSEDANIILGSVIDERVGDEVVVTVIATGFEEHPEERTHDLFARRVQASTTSPVASVKKDITENFVYAPSTSTQRTAAPTTASSQSTTVHATAQPTTVETIAAQPIITQVTTAQTPTTQPITIQTTTQPIAQPITQIITQSATQTKTIELTATQPVVSQTAPVQTITAQSTTSPSTIVQQTQTYSTTAEPVGTEATTQTSAAVVEKLTATPWIASTDSTTTCSSTTSQKECSDATSQSAQTGETSLDEEQCSATGVESEQECCEEKASEQLSSKTLEQAKKEIDLDDLDTPAFLRKQVKQGEQQSS